MAQYAAAIDQGTTSTRFMVFDHGGQVVSVDQKEHEQIYPKPGWVEHDANEIWERTQEMVKAGVGKTQASDIAAVGVTNQRETTVVWDRSTGQPVHNAIVWQDTRTDQICNELNKLLEGRGIEIARNLIGPYITSLEMAGCSITLLKLDDELKRLWDAPVNTPGLRWGV